MTRITALFDRLRRERRKALVGYLTAGDPNPDRTPALVAALVRGGVDLIELGVPFSDPIADGPVIERASHRALKAGTTVRGVLDIAARIRKSSEVPLLLFTYLNPVLRFGFDAVVREAKASGIDGLLLTDLTIEEAGPYASTARSGGLDTIFLAAPTSTAERLREIASHSSGFVYLVSRTGVTGERDSLSDAVAPLVKAMRGVTELPLALGFGISRPEHVEAASHLVDAVVVGSAIVRLIEQHGSDPSDDAKLEEFARKLKKPLEVQTS